MNLAENIQFKLRFPFARALTSALQTAILFLRHHGVQRSEYIGKGTDPFNNSVIQNNKQCSEHVAKSALATALSQYLISIGKRMNKMEISLPQQQCLSEDMFHGQ